MDDNEILNIRVAGVTFEGRQDKIARIHTRDAARIVPEPDNPFDANALAVHVAHAGEIYHIGYIPRDMAAKIAPWLDGESLMVRIAEITGGFVKEDGEVTNLGVRLEVEIPMIALEQIDPLEARLRAVLKTAKG
jgi:hypothetical protein